MITSETMAERKRYDLESIRVWAAHRDNTVFSRDVVLDLIHYYDQLACKLVIAEQALQKEIK